MLLPTFTPKCTSKFTESHFPEIRLVYDTCKTNKTAVKETTVQRISKFRKDVHCMLCKRRVVFSLNTTFNKHYNFRPPCTKMCKGLLPQLRIECPTKRIVQVCAHLSAMQVAHRWNFVKNDLFSKITLEKSTAGRERQNALVVM